ncbi:MAG: nitrate ABC transporter substrate-binding protein [Deltaproteobacteria bacterium]|nr:MAG: nitrate ABC transporter substrate-binding protein [Deltaproteobacteria bacterium]
MKKPFAYWVISFVLGFMLAIFNPAQVKGAQAKKIGMAVEFMDHAACAYVARDKGWFKQAGLNISSYESYVTGIALAAALARGDIQAAYLCLVPAINVFANAGVKIKIVAGTHKYGYGLVVDPHKVKTVKDLENQGVRIGCVREGGAVDVLLNKTMEKFHLSRRKILPRIQRMNPPNQVLAIKMARLDAAFLPEQWATMAEACGFRMLLTARDLWPNMQGSVLVVKEGLIERQPEAVQKLVEVTRSATQWINSNRDEAAAILARQLSAAQRHIFPTKAARSVSSLQITPRVLLKSMARLEYETNIADQGVQDIIDYVARLGYIAAPFPAHHILDLRFVSQ